MPTRTERASTEAEQGALKGREQGRAQGHAARRTTFSAVIPVRRTGLKKSIGSALRTPTGFGCLSPVYGQKFQHSVRIHNSFIEAV